MDAPALASPIPRRTPPPAPPPPRTLSPPSLVKSAVVAFSKPLTPRNSEPTPATSSGEVNCVTATPPRESAAAPTAPCHQTDAATGSRESLNDRCALPSRWQQPQQSNLLRSRKDVMSRRSVIPALLFTLLLG